MSETVYVVDDDISVRESLSSLIRAMGLQVLTFDSAQAFLATERLPGPSCLVLDVRMPGVTGLALHEDLCSKGDPIPVIFITGNGDIPTAVRAMKCGALEFLPKPFLEDELVSAIRHGLDKDRTRRLETADIQELRRRFATLTSREREVIGFINQGALNKQSAAALGVTEITIKVHRHNIMRKMEARSLPDLVRMMEKLQGQ